MQYIARSPICWRTLPWPDHIAAPTTPTHPVIRREGEGVCVCLQRCLVLSQQEEGASQLLLVLCTVGVELHGLLEQLQREGHIALLASYQSKHINGIFTCLVCFSQQLANQHLQMYTCTKGWGQALPPMHYRLQSTQFPPLAWSRKESWSKALMTVMK